MNRDDALELLAKERDCTAEDVRMTTCRRSRCLNSVCIRLRELEAQEFVSVPVARGALPLDDTARLDYPMADGLLYYFPAALAEVARVSKIGNDQHNPGLPLHWARSKSTDHENKILRHLTEAGTKDAKGVRHTARLAWRALALLQVELEREEGAPPPRNARF